MESNQKPTTELTQSGAIEGIRGEIAGLGIEEAIKRVRDLTQAGVKSDDDARILTNAGVDLKNKSAFVEGRRSEVYVPFYRKAEELREVFDSPIKAIKSALSVARDAIGEHQTRKARESELVRIAQEAEAQKAREAAERAHWEAEQARADAEAKASAEEEASRLARALEAEKHGSLAQADAILATPTPVIQSGPTPEEIKAQEAAQLAAEAAARAQAAIEAAGPQKLDGFSGSARWTWTVSDIKALCRAVADGEVPPSYVGFDESKPDAFKAPQVTKDVDHLKARFKCPGIRAYPKASGSFKATKERAV